MTGQLLAMLVPLLVLFAAQWLIVRWMRLIALAESTPPFKPNEVVVYRYKTPVTMNYPHVPKGTEKEALPRVIRCVRNPRRNRWDVVVAFDCGKDCFHEAVIPARELHRAGIIERLAELA